MDRRDIKLQAKGLMKDNWGILLLAILLESVFATIAGLFSLGVASVVVTGPLAVGVMYIYYDVSQGRKGEWMDIFKGFRTNFGDAVLANILLTIVKVIPTIVAFIGFMGTLINMFRTIIYGSYGYYGGSYSDGGSSFGSILWSIFCLAITVAAVYLIFSYAMTIYILMREPSTSAVYAMKRSRLMMVGNKMKYFVFILSFLGWAILGCLTFGLLFIWVQPYYRTAEFLFFQSIYEEKKGINMNYDPLKEKFVKPAPQQPNNTYYNVEGAKFCQTCGAPMPEDAAFCGHCGTKQNQ